MNNPNHLLTPINAPTVGSSSEVRVAIDADHAILRGHFPGRPVVPGVCLVEMATRICSAMLGSEHLLAGSRAVKFLVPVEPRSTQELTYSTQIQHPEEGIRAEIVVRSGETVVMKMNATLVPAKR